MHLSIHQRCGASWPGHAEACPGGLNDGGTVKMRSQGWTLRDLTVFVIAHDAPLLPRKREGGPETEEEKTGGQRDQPGGTVFNEPIARAGKERDRSSDGQHQRAALFGAPEVEPPHRKRDDRPGGDHGALRPALPGPEEGVESPETRCEIAENAVARILRVGPAKAVKKEKYQCRLQPGMKAPRREPRNAQGNAQRAEQSSFRIRR